MLGLRDTRRVRRGDLDNSSEEDEEAVRGRSDGSSDELRAKFHARMAALLEVNAVPTVGNGSGSQRAAPPAEAVRQSVDRTQAVEEEEGGDQLGFRLRLFAPRGGPDDSPAPRILLSPEAEGRAGDDVPVRRRPLSYYVKPVAGPEEKERFRLAALTAEEVRTTARQRNWGLEVPWRATKVVVSVERVKGGAEGGERPRQSEDEGQNKRKRPGKKARMRHRVTERTRLEKETAAQKEKLTKEEHLKAKKQRLNREKKLKRRQKEKDKKAAAAAATADGAIAADPDSGLDEAEGESDAANSTH